LDGEKTNVKLGRGSKLGIGPKLNLFLFLPFELLLASREVWMDPKKSQALVQFQFQSQTRIHFFSFCSIRAFLGAKKTLNGAKIICRAWARLQIQSWVQSRQFCFSSELLLVPKKASMEQEKAKLKFDSFFFCSCKASLSAEKSLEGAQRAQLKPREYLGCLAPIFSLA
jgi:hypothetical protein